MLPGKLWGYLVSAAVLALGAAPGPAKVKEERTRRPAVDSSQVHYGPAPAWILAAPQGTETPTPAGAPYRVIYYDTQLRFDKDHDESVTAFRVRILTPQALAIGSLSLTWNPASQDVTVNGVRIHRAGTEIDVLQNARFSVIQREANLEMAMLTGILTATMQVPGLQVGDELEFRSTIQNRDNLLGNHTFGAIGLPLAEGPGTNRIRVGWTSDRQPVFRPSQDLKPLALGSHPLGAIWEVRDPAKVVPVEGAPSRYNIWRVVEYSDFSDWQQVSRTFDALFEGAATLKADSPLRAEIERIAARSGDPIVRAGDALKLAQEQVRYVYVGLNGGNYRPITADETWRNRFGDCKAKSVLLLTLLRNLGVTAEVVAVSSSGGDGLDQRLPGPHVFDHVLVRATIAGKRYYLDATKSGDHVLPLLEHPRFRYVLPLSKEGSDLEALELLPPRRPRLIRTISMDASTEQASVTQVNYVLGEDGAFVRGQLAALSPEQSDRALRGYWQNEESWIVPDEVSWRYDEVRAAAILTIKGKADPDWDGDAQSGRSMNTPRGGFYPPQERKRPSTQDQSLPWQTDFPSYVCSVTNVRLPKPSNAKFIWDYDSAAIDTKIGGEHYVRQAGLADGVFRTIRISKTYLAELSAEQAKAIKAAIPGFNNEMSQVYERQPEAGEKGRSRFGFAVPLVDAVDWTAPNSPCTITENGDRYSLASAPSK